MVLAVSVGISPRQSLASWTDLAGELEAEGVDELWLIDSQLAMKDVYAGLLLAAQRTSRMLLGPGVTNPLTRHPTVTACAVAAVAEVSGGRAALGLGAGDSAVHGLGWQPARVAQVEAAIRFLRAVLRGEQAEWEGRAHRLPYAAGPVPVWLGCAWSETPLAQVAHTGYPSSNADSGACRVQTPERHAAGSSGDPPPLRSRV